MTEVKFLIESKRTQPDIRTINVVLTLCRDNALTTQAYKIMAIVSKTKDLVADEITFNIIMDIANRAKDYYKVQPTLQSPNIRDIRNPDCIRFSYCKVLFQ